MWETQPQANARSICCTVIDAARMKVAQEEVTLPMLIRTSFGSPFGRKARIAVSVLGLDGKVKVESATTQDPSDPLRQQNPLGKIPVLILDDGSALYNSPVILEYLDHLAGGGKIIPTDFKARFDALQAAGARRRHHGCVDPDRLRRPLPAGREARAEMARPAAGQGRPRARRARSVAARRSIRRPRSARSRSPARSAIASSASPARCRRTARGLSPGSRISPRACRRSRRPSRRRADQAAA